MKTIPAFDLTGQTTLITGGGSGIGLAMAQCFAAAGAKVILVGRRADVLREAATSLGAAFEVHDVTDLAGLPQFVERVEATHGPVSILANNAGIHMKKPALEVSDADFQSVMSTHINAGFALSREFGQRMVERGSGHILFTASMASYMGIPLVVAYATAKSGMLGLVRVLASELSPHGVRVNAIAPGWIETEMSAKAMAGDPARKQKVLSRTPMNRFGEPDDIGWAAVYLSSPAAKYVTGVCLPVDGGTSIGF